MVYFKMVNFMLSEWSTLCYVITSIVFKKQKRNLKRGRGEKCELTSARLGPRVLSPRVAKREPRGPS